MKSKETDAERIDNRIKTNGYVDINFGDQYFYSAGLGLRNKPDVIGLPMYPLGLFQVALSRFAAGEAEVDKPFFLYEYKVKTDLMGEEPIRCVFRTLDFDTCQHLLTGLMTTARKYRNKGVVVLLAADKHNFLPNEPESLIQLDIDEHLIKLAKTIHEEIDKTANEAKRLLRALGGKPTK